MKAGRIGYLFVMLMTLPLMAMASEPAESGMITLVQGNVSYSAPSEKAKAVVPFMKTHVGDKIAVPKNGKVQILYFSGGRQESWQGEAVIEIGAKESKAGKTATQPAIKQLPPAVLQRLAKAPAVLTDIRTRTGMVMVRSLPSPEEARELDESYTALRGQATEDDVTPELYLLSGLYEMKRYREMKKPLEDIKRRQPDNPEIIAIANHYTEIMERKGVAAPAAPAAPAATDAAEATE